MQPQSRHRFDGPELQWELSNPVPIALDLIVHVHQPVSVPCNAARTEVRVRYCLACLVRHYLCESDIPSFHSRCCKPYRRMCRPPDSGSRAAVHLYHDSERHYALHDPTSCTHLAAAEYQVYSEL